MTRGKAVLLGMALAFVAVLVTVRLTASGQPQAPVGQPPAAQERPVLRALGPEPGRLADDDLGGLRFVDVTQRAGLATDGSLHPRLRPHQMDAGAAVADVDADGDLDLLLTSAGGASGLHRNDGGRFTRVAGRAAIPEVDRATVPVFFEADGDGDLDLFLGGPGHRFGRLLVNDGSGSFVDRSRERGVVGRPAREAGARSVRGADVGDIDLDGDLDLLVTDWNPGAVVAAEVAHGEGSDRFTGQCHFADTTRRALAAGRLEVTGDTRLFRNDGTGHFTDVTTAWGLGGLGIALAFTPQLADLDGDGWLDLAVTGDTCTSALFHNQRGRRFVEVTGPAGVGRDENGMGSLIRDLDGDGRPDWLVTGIAYPTAGGTCPQVSLFAGCSGNRAYLNEGDLTFRDATDDLGLRDSGWAWGVVGEDFGNDGRLQIAVTNGRVGTGDVDPQDQAEVYYETFRDDRTQFWVRPDGEDYVDVAEQVGVDHDGVGHALVAFDHDRDGRLDLLVADAGAPPHLYRNVSTPRRHWLTIRLHDSSTPGNPAGLGARIEVTTAQGATTTRWMATSGSYESQQPAEVHVGLGDDGDPVTAVRVWWPGEERPQVARDVAPDRLVTLTREGAGPR